MAEPRDSASNTNTLLLQQLLGQMSTVNQKLGMLEGTVNGMEGRLTNEAAGRHRLISDFTAVQLNLATVVQATKELKEIETKLETIMPQIQTALVLARDVEALKLVQIKIKERVDTLWTIGAVMIFLMTLLGLDGLRRLINAFTE